MGEIFGETFEIFWVEGIVDVGAEIEREFLGGEIEFAGGFGADFGEMSQAEGQGRGKIGG